MRPIEQGVTVNEDRTLGCRSSQPELKTDTKATTHTSVTTTYNPTQNTIASSNVEMKEQKPQVQEQHDDSQGNQEAKDQTQEQDPTQDQQNGEQQCIYQDTTPTIMSVDRVGDKHGTSEKKPTLFTEGDLYHALQPPDLPPDLHSSYDPLYQILRWVYICIPI